MTETHVCPQCGAELKDGDPEGLCPRCLLKHGLGESSVQVALHETPTTNYGPFTAPTPVELAGRFPHLEVVEFLGQGGMGAVYKARQTKLDRLVALKVLPPEWGKDPAFAERFAREARALAKLNHPHVVTVHDFGEAGGLYYLVMEYIDGANLRQLMGAGRLAPEEALRIVPQICDALQYAHEEGVIHRDIKPENILLDKKGRVKIADFGLAKLVGQPRPVYSLTGSQQVVGTVDYMAPEQRSTPQHVDHRADIYALGVVFYEMLTGELPLGRFAAPSRKAAVDARLDEVVFRALEREPERRYQHASEVKRDLDGLAAPAEVQRDPEAAKEETITVPCSWGPYGSLKRTHCFGLLRFNGETLTLEVEIQEEELDLKRPHRGWEARKTHQEVTLLLSEVVSVQFQRGWCVRSLHIQAARMSLLADLPGAKQGQLKVTVAAKDCDAAELLAARVMRQLGGESASSARQPVPAEAGRRPAADLELVQMQLKGPAAGLMVTAAVALLSAFAAAVALIVIHGGSQRAMGIPREVFLFLLGAGMVVAFLIIGIMVAGARRMARLESYELAIVAIILAMVPIPYHFLVGVPVGIWALRVLRRPEVQAAFAANLRRRGAPRREEPPPAKPIRGRLRSMLGSVRSLFFGSRVETGASVVEEAAQPAAPRPSARAPSPAGPADASPPAEEASKPRWATPGMVLMIIWLLGILALAAVAFVASSGISKHESSQAPSREAPVPGVDPQLAAKLRLDSGTARQLNRILRDGYEDYLALEGQHAHLEDDDPKRLVVTIAPFPQELDLLEQRVLRNLNQLLSTEQNNRLRAHLPLRGGLFPFGQAEARLLFQREEPPKEGFSWSVSSAPGSLPRTILGEKLPEQYERFWMKHPELAKYGEHGLAH
jgi:serine/threonine protein kinase